MTSSFGRAFTLSPTRPDNNILPFSSLKRSVVETVAINWEGTSLRVYNALGLATLRQCKSSTHNTTLLEIDDGKRGEIKVVGRLGISSQESSGGRRNTKEKRKDDRFLVYSQPKWLENMIESYLGASRSRLMAQEEM